MFDFKNFSFSKKKESGLTNQSGLYLIINKTTSKIYLGCASDLAQRKGDHHRNFKNPDRTTSVYSSMSPDLNLAGADSFYFVPILAFPIQNVIHIPSIPFTKNQQVSSFLEEFVESVLLEDFIGPSAPANIKNLFYNVKVSGRFQENNKYGGSPNSGSPSASLFYALNSGSGEIAFESVSAAAKILNCETKNIRTKRDKNILQPLTAEEFKNFSSRPRLKPKGSFKVTNQGVEDFKNNYKDIVEELRKELTPNKRKSN